MASPEPGQQLTLFRVLAESHREAIYRLAYRLAGNRDDAEDLVQESLLEAFRAFGRFTVGTRFDRWLSRILVRNFIDQQRRTRGREAVSLEEVISDSQLRSRDADPQAMVEGKAKAEQLQAALNRISPELRATVMLCDGQGLSYEEAGRALGCPVGTVRSRLHRARAQLRQRLAESAAEESE